MGKFQVNKPRFIFYLYRGGFAFCFNLMTTVSIIYQIQRVKLNPLQLVVVGAVLELSCLIFEIPTGVMADLYSRKASICLGLLMMGAGIFIEGFFPVFILVLLAQIIWGVGATFLSGADVAWLTDEIGVENVERTLWIGAQVYQIASIAGVVVSIALAALRVNYPILLSGLLFAFLGCCLFLAMPEKHFRPASVNQEPLMKKYLAQVRMGIRHVVNYRSLSLFFLALFLGGLYNEGFDRLWAYHLLKDIGMVRIFHWNELYWFAVIQIGLLLLNFLFLKLVENKIAGQPVRALYRIIMGANLVLLLGLLLFARSSNFYYALAAFWMVMAARCFNDPLHLIIVNRTITDSQIRATVLSMKGQMDQVGQIIGGIGIGLIANAFSVAIGLQVSSLIVVLIIAILFWIYRRTNHGNLADNDANPGSERGN